MVIVSVLQSKNLMNLSNLKILEGNIMVYANSHLDISRRDDLGVVFHPYALRLGNCSGAEHVCLSKKLYSKCDHSYDDINPSNLTFRRRRKNGKPYLDLHDKRDKSLYLVLEAKPQGYRGAINAGGLGKVMIPKEQNDPEMIAEAYGWNSKEFLGALNESWDTKVIRIKPTKAPLVFSTVWEDRFHDRTSTVFVVTYDDNNGWHVHKCDPADAEEYFRTIGIDMPFTTQVVRRHPTNPTGARVELVASEWRRL